MKALCVPQTRALYKPPGSWRFCTVSKLFLGLCSSGRRPFDVGTLHLVGCQQLELKGCNTGPFVFGSVSYRDLGTSSLYCTQMSLYTIPAGIYCINLHLTSCYYMLDSLHNTFVQSATWVLLSMVDSCLYGSDGICQRYRPSWGLVVHDGSSSCSNHCLSSAASDLNRGWGWGTYLHPAL